MPVYARKGLTAKALLVVNGYELPEEVMRLCTTVMVERSLDKCDLITVNIENPFQERPKERRTSELVWTDSMLWMPGQLMEVYVAWENDPWSFLGAGITRKVNPYFPRDGMPTLEVKAFDASCLMMDGTTEINAFAARTFQPGTSITDMVMFAAKAYGFGTEHIDTTTKTPRLSIVAQKKNGMSDYQFLKGAANTVNWDFFVAWNLEDQRWDLYFRPQQKANNEPQTFTWGPDFERNGGVGGLLLDFDPEFAVQGKSTDVEVFYWDRGAGLWEKVPWPPKPPPKRKSKEAPFRWAGDNTQVGEDLAAIGNPDEARGLRIQASGISIEVVTPHGFTSPEEAASFAQAWWTARQESIMTGPGSIMGHPDMQPGTVHNLQGIGGYSGQWYIADTTHTIRDGAVYETQFQARRVFG